MVLPTGCNPGYISFIFWNVAVRFGVGVGRDDLGNELCSEFYFMLVLPTAMLVIISSVSDLLWFLTLRMFPMFGVITDC